MLKPWCFLHLFFLYSALNCAVGHESVELSTLVTFPRTDITTSAVSLPIQHLYEVSTSVLEAENWLRSNVLAHYPSTNITTILVGHTLLCKKNQENRMSLILPSAKNIYYSLTRWGLHNEIKVSTSFSTNCLNQDSGLYNLDLGEKYIKPLLDFFQHVNAPYVVNLGFLDVKIETLMNSHLGFGNLDVKIETLMNSHKGFVKKLGNFSLNKIFLISENLKQERRLLSRKLSTFDSKYTNFPTRPTPLAPNPNPHSPAFAANTPLPPLIGNISPPFAPEMSPPLFNPISPSYNGPHLPPCIPSHGGGWGGGGGPVGAPATGGHGGGGGGGLWCVAKPSVPPETLQEALDYACGEGDADCEAISPSGSCYYPDTIVAHASYAFNSYWQKTKANGGTCGFGGTAMLINSDPSYLHCRFILA